MATLNKVYTFATGNEGFSLVNMTRNTTDQCLENAAIGRNTKVDGTATLQTVFSAIGIPSGATITHIQLSFDHRCTTYNVVDYARFDAYLNGVESSPLTIYNGTTSWATITGTGQNVDLTPSSVFTILIGAYCDNGNNSSASSTIQFDNVTLTVTYTEQSYDKTGIVSISNGNQESINSHKSNSTFLQSTVGFQENLASQKVGISSTSDSLGDVLSVVGYNSTIYDFESSVTISDGDVVTVSTTRHTSSSVSLSNGEQISIAGNSDIPTYDFTVIVNESLGVQESVSGIKQTRASPEMTDGINLDLFGVKSIIAIPSESIGVEKTVSYYKSNVQPISLSNGINLLAVGTNATTYFYTGTVSLTGGDQTVLSSQKQSMSLLAISEGSIELGEGSKSVESVIDMATGDIGLFNSTKKSSGLVSLYEGVRVTVLFKLPYIQLIALLEHQNRAPLITQQDYKVAMSYTDKLVRLSADDSQVKVSSINCLVKLEVEYVSLQNNTVRLKAEFRDFDGQLITPDDVVLRIYNAKKVQIGEDIPVLPVSEGLYTYDYVLETDVYGSIFYEFAGLVNNLPILGRNRIDITWM